MELRRCRKSAIRDPEDTAAARLLALAPERRHADNGAAQLLGGDRRPAPVPVRAGIRYEGILLPGSYNFV